MKKSRNVAVITVATIGVAISCSTREEQQAVCVDGSNRVVERASCATNDGGGYFWYYHGAYANGRYPEIGTQVRSGGTAVRATASVERGGFGSTARNRSVHT